MNLIKSKSALLEAARVWLNRTDVATLKALPYCIGLAEEDFNKLVKIPEYETMKVYTVGTDHDVSSATSAINLPDDFDEVKALFVNGKPCFIQSNETFYQYSDNSSPAFTKIGEQILIKPTLKDKDIVTLIYFRTMEHMDNDYDAPPHLVKAPDVMLFLTLRQGALFLRDTDMFQYWESKAQEAVISLQQKIDSERWNGSTVVIPA